MAGFFTNRRGISPLAATLLLILMSVGLGVAVMSWGEKYIEQRAEFVQGVQEAMTSCDLVSFSIITIGGVQQLCQEGAILKGLIDNGADADIADFHARVVAEKGIFAQERLLDKPVPRGSAAPVQFSIGDIGAVKQLKLTPKILIQGAQAVCSKQAMVFENIRAC